MRFLPSWPSRDALYQPSSSGCLLTSKNCVKKDLALGKTQAWHYWSACESWKSWQNVNEWLVWINKIDMYIEYITNKQIHANPVRDTPTKTFGLLWLLRCHCLANLHWLRVKVLSSGQNYWAELYTVLFSNLCRDVPSAIHKSGQCPCSIPRCGLLLKSARTLPTRNRETDKDELKEKNRLNHIWQYPCWFKKGYFNSSVSICMQCMQPAPSHILTSQNCLV